jgi:hypothetical protein
MNAKATMTTLTTRDTHALEQSNQRRQLEAKQNSQGYRDNDLATKIEQRYNDYREDRCCHRAQKGNQFFRGSRFEGLPDHSLLPCQKSDVFLDPCICVRFRWHISGNLVYCRHYCARRRLMHHVAGASISMTPDISNYFASRCKLLKSEAPLGAL